MSVLPIRLYPDPVLRVRCPPVESFDKALQTLIGDMTETMHAAPGIGLAAPQIGEELRLALVDLSVGEEPDALLILVNPEIISSSGKASDSEGCLSIPDYTEKVTRPETIVVRAQDENGESYELEADGLLARAIQHELDHLNGVLFVDHLRGLRRERARRMLKRLQEEELARASA